MGVRGHACDFGHEHAAEQGGLVNISYLDFLEICSDPGEGERGAGLSSSENTSAECIVDRTRTDVEQLDSTPQRKRRCACGGTIRGRCRRREKFGPGP